MSKKSPADTAKRHPLDALSQDPAWEDLRSILQLGNKLAESRSRVRDATASSSIPGGGGRESGSAPTSWAVGLFSYWRYLTRAPNGVAALSRVSFDLARVKQGGVSAQ